MTQDQPRARWQIMPLGEVVTLQRGKDLPEHDRTQGPFPVVGSNGIVGYHAESVARGPGVLVGRSGSVGKVTWVEGDYWPLNTSLWVTDFHSNHPEFVFHFLTHLDLGKHTAGVSVPTLNRNVLHPLHVSVPPYSEQRAIARALRAVHEAREARRREAALERERKAALIQQLFTRGTQGEPTKPTEIGEIPESWGIVRLGDCLASDLQNGLYKPQECYGEGTPIIRIDAFDNEGSFVSNEFKRVRLSAAEIDTWRVREGDVLINRVNSLSHLGKCAFVPPLKEPTVYESNMMRFRVDESRMLAEYLIRYLVTDGTRERIRSMAKRAVAQSSINQGDVKSLAVPLPPRQDQETIVLTLRACDAKIAAVEREATLLDELFRALLEELMTGRLSAVPLIELEATSSEGA